MAGHSKWSNIQHRKGAQDKKRAKIFTKIIREITVAAKAGGSDLSSNPRLRTVVDKANGANMPKDNINRAIKRGAGGDDDINMFETRYEGYGTNGVAVIVDCLTDNKNRTAAEIRHAFSKCGGNLGTSGCVSYLFEHIGIININNADEEQLMDVAIGAGAEDILIHKDQSAEVHTSTSDLHVIKDELTNNNIACTDAETTFIASTEVKLNLEQAEKMMRLVDMLEDLDDVQNVYTNAHIADEIIDKLL
jgi:YebC/PmpR family DNA-binding regulatory protein